MPKRGSTITGYFPPRLGVPVLHVMNQYVKRPDTGHTGASANTRSYTSTPSVRLFTEQRLRESSGVV